MMKSGMIRTTDQEDFIVNKFQEAMGKFEDIQKQMTVLFQSVNDFSKNIQENLKLHFNLEEKFANFSRSSKDTFQVLGAQILSSGNISNELVNHKKEFERKSGDIDSKVLFLKDQIQEMKNQSKEFIKIGNLEEIKDFFKNMDKSFNCEIQKQKEKNISHENRVSSLNSYTESIQKDLQDHKIYTKKIANSLDNLVMLHSSLEMNYKKDIQEMKNALTKFIEDSISSIPKPVIPSLDDARKAMEDKIQPASLDAKNANLRSSNNESKIYILEKKVEQLQLLINKLQLQG